MSEQVDFYAVLGVDPAATPDEIHRAYRERVKGCHPDRVAGMDGDIRRVAEKKMINLNEAHRILRDPDLRARYDATRRAPTRRAAPAPRAEPGPAAADTRTNGRDRISGQDLIMRAATEQLRGRVVEAGRDYRWVEADAGGLTLALDGRRGRRRDLVLISATNRLDERILVSTLRRFHSMARASGSSWWRREAVHGFVAAVHFADLDRLKEVVERFNDSQAGDGRPLHAALVDLVNWTATPGPRALEDQLQFLQS